ncbi:hypothetical protein ACSNOB_03255 [Micromonospora sp. URMC 106]|uniref:hypothetical protein n=1 Tax=Micromonospora sp. URMC 106 TaxID=3423408 RepID=UPI003F1CE297
MMGPVVKATPPDGTYGIITFDCAGDRRRVVQLERSAAMTDFIERLVIKASFTSDDVDFVSMQRGWILEQAQRREAGAYIDSWVTLDGKTEIHQVASP